MSVDQLVSQWTAVAGSDQELNGITKLLAFLSEELYRDYEPYAEWPIFWERLGSWIQNVEGESDQQNLFRLVPWLLFFGKEEMKAMYRAAFA